MRKHLQEVEMPTRAARVIRLSRLGEYLGIKHTAIDQMIQRGQLHPFCITGAGGRAKVVWEDEVAALQHNAFIAALAEKNDDEAA
jgi:hypothetical protein